MLVCTLTVTVGAATVVNIFNLTVTAPVVGQKPSNTASLPTTASTYVVSVRWEGEFDDEGRFMAGKDYTVYATVRVKEGLDKTIKFVSASTIKVNGQLANLGDFSSDKKQAVLSYTFRTPGASTGGTSSSSTKPQTNGIAFEDMSVSAYEWEVVRLCNIERAKEGLPSLAVLPALQDACDIREKELEISYSHTRPNGASCETVIPGEIPWTIASENIAKGQTDPEMVVKGWMNSTGHRKNILNAEHGYIGVGYSSASNCWVQLFIDRKDIKSCTVNTTEREFTPEEIKDVVLTLKSTDGYTSFMPVSFEAMTLFDGKYRPRMIVSSGLPAFVKKEEAAVQPETPVTPVTPEVTPEQPTEPVPPTPVETMSLFDRFIPTAQVYGVIDVYMYDCKEGKTVKLLPYTQYYSADKNADHPNYDYEKRSEHKDGFIKVRYVGRFGEVDKNLILDYLGICTETEYDEIINGKERSSTYELPYTITKETIIVALDLYDKNKNLVCTLTPANIIYSANDKGEFLTYSCKNNRYIGSYLFTFNDAVFKLDEDITRNKTGKHISFVNKYIMLEDLDIVKGFMNGGILASNEEKYKFIEQPTLTGTSQYNTNNIISDKEFITPDNTYYFVGPGPDVDPVVKVTLKNVTDYTAYRYTEGYKRFRNILTSDGTLHAVSEDGEYKVIATNIKKGGKYHYLTNDGNVVEIVTGKVIATDCRDFEESFIDTVVGVLKNDNSFWLGHSYRGDAKSYEQGLTKLKENVKMILPDAIIDSKNTLYRWREDTVKGGMDENAWSMGQFVTYDSYVLKLEMVCSDVVRVFTDELLSKVDALQGSEIYKQRLTSFAVTENGDLYGYSLWHDEMLASKLGMVEKIFPMHESDYDGNFIGILVEGKPTPYAIMCRYCDKNTYRLAQVYDGVTGEYPVFTSVTRGGFRGTDGTVYSLDSDGIAIEKDLRVYADRNLHADLGAMHRGTSSYRAFSYEGKTAKMLLPSVAAWAYDSKGIILLERTDGSMWAGSIINLDFNTELVARLDGYSNSNAIQITQPTTAKVGPEYITIPKDMPTGVEVKPAFTDVADDAYYAAPVAWAVDKAITNGTSATTFSPDNTCTRAQILTFLWRAVGSPISVKENPFTDVRKSDYYYNAAIWAHAIGIISGTTFGGDTPCTREETVVYLWKNAGSPSVSSKGTSFTDVKPGTECETAVKWALEKGVTSGTSATTFSPEATCTRGQIVTFLYRALKR